MVCELPTSDTSKASPSAAAEASASVGRQVSLYDQLRRSVTVAKETPHRAPQRILAYARFLNRCYCSIRKEYTGNSFLRAYPESSSQFSIFIRLASKFESLQKTTGRRVDAVGFFRANFDVHKEDTYVNRLLGEGAWYWYSRWLANRYTRTCSYDRAEKLGQRAELKRYLANVWEMSEQEVVRAFKPIFP